MHPAYLETRFRVEDPLGALPSQFVILSAYATTGEVWSEERNSLADQKLFRELQASTPTFLKRVVGYSPSTHHAEPSWAVAIPLAEAHPSGIGSVASPTVPQGTAGKLVAAPAAQDEVEVP